MSADLAVEGAMAAARHADRMSADWTEQAVALFVEFCLARPGETFMTEDVRDWAEERGLPVPPDRRAWGAVTMVVRRAGIIRSLGYAPQRSRNAHRAPKTLWVTA